MSARDDLADELWKHHYEEYTMNPDGTERSHCRCGAAAYPLKSLVQHQAEAALTAGYRKPRTITTIEELDALPAGSVVDDGELVFERGLTEWFTPMSAGGYPASFINLPATLLVERQDKR